MIYRLGQRVKPGRSKAVISLLGVVALLLGGVIGNLYARQSPFQKSTQANWSLSSSFAHQPAANKNKTNINAGVSSQDNLRVASCFQLFPPRHASLANSSNPELKKLAQYEEACDGALADRTSFFVPTPTTVAEAKSDAAEVASRLKQYSDAGIKPLVFLEPTTSNGNIDLNLYRSGAYDSALDVYFADVRANGVTDAMMGVWVIMPEGNTPAWNSVDPSTFATNVTRTIRIQKKYFPRSQASIMLDSETYSSASSWDNGSYKSLLPYVQDIPKGLVDSFGLQGFPWAPPANQSNDKYYDPAIYLRTDLAAGAAKILGVSNIWFNTGTFSHMYTNNVSQTVTAQPIERQKMLDGTLAQAKNLKNQGFNVSIHLFTEDKSGTSEAIDWSYWHSAPGNDGNSTVFRTFVHDAKTSDIPIWLFDTDEH